jgi:hypothetical protein
MHNPLNFAPPTLNVMLLNQGLINALDTIVMIIIPFYFSNLGKEHGIFILAISATGCYPLIVSASRNL